MKLLIVFALMLTITLADKLPTNSYNGAPYPPSGWKPQGSGLQLPTEYGPASQQRSDVEITQEQVEYAGQLVESTTTEQLPPNNAYLPSSFDNTDSEIPSEIPTTENNLQVQGLPATDSPNYYNSQNGQLNTGEFIPTRQTQQQQRPFINRSNQQQRFVQFRQPQQIQPQQQQQQAQKQITRFPVNGRVQLQPTGNVRQFSTQFAPQQQQQRQQQQQQQLEQEQQEPTNFAEYGPPPTAVPTQRQPKYDETTPVNNYDNDNNNNNDYDDQQQPQQDDESDNENGPAIAIANSFANGQYYVLSKDNSLQRVVYMTTQTEADRLNNGFTAQLRYSPVEPIRDPIYAFDAQGQLIRLYNKKK